MIGLGRGRSKDLEKGIRVGTVSQKHTLIPGIFVSLSCPNRCTIVEPGPVETPLFQTGADWGETIDHSTADQKTQQLMKLGVAGMEKMKTKSLKASQIAAIVKEIILGQNNNFRCYTNVDFLPNELAAKMKDPFSNEFIDLLGKRFFEETKE